MKAAHSAWKQLDQTQLVVLNTQAKISSFFKEICLGRPPLHFVKSLCCIVIAVFHKNMNRCSPCLLEHERCHGGVTQAADRSGCEREVHRGASVWVHPRMHCVWSAGHPSLPWLAGWPPGEMNLTSTTVLSSLPWNQLVLLSSCVSSIHLFWIHYKY